MHDGHFWEQQFRIGLGFYLCLALISYVVLTNYF